MLLSLQSCIYSTTPLGSFHPYAAFDKLLSSFQSNARVFDVHSIHSIHLHLGYAYEILYEKRLQMSLL